MLFNSPVFLFAFLPLSIWLFWRAIKVRSRIQILVVMSLIFYGWWDPAYLLLIGASIAINYWVGHKVATSRTWIVAGIAFNLGLLAIFKYADFAIGSFNAVTGSSFPMMQLALPLAISFFTFQQIAYLVECRRGQAPERDPLIYALFVLFFPQLIAGPIVQYREVGPQFRVLGVPIRADLFAQGVFLLTLGLFKKVAISDQLAKWVDPAFASPGDLHFYDAWVAVLSYTLQLYFDFSAYSEMAMGLAMMFGIVLPLNFNAPYKAGNIAEFWRRWHITLGRFMRDYVYVPLGGNRNGYARQLAALMITMVLGGLWHGAAWTFVAWGALHGIYLVLHRVWTLTGMRLPNALGVGTTFLAVVWSWVLFRAQSLQDAMLIWKAMLGQSGMEWPRALAPILGPGVEYRYSPYYEGYELIPIVLLLLAVWRAPTVHEIWQRHVRSSPRWAVAVASVGLVAFFHLSTPQEFAYFQF